ncbi:hypothetical protein [Paenibacillus alvei]|uniref:Uncharacterized protein n=1 Tax=Paenibacillus alvei TaxID=44250 RepID=A0AAP7A045_PAEAL|nr:hypothetical protein [Paenibacillus alvei]NOJ73185.1 hypothetical protein [Paenibacillus alvei]
MGIWSPLCPFFVGKYEINSGQTLEIPLISVIGDEKKNRIRQIFWKAIKAEDDGTEEIIPVSLVYKEDVTENYYECMRVYNVAFHNHSEHKGNLDVYVMQERCDGHISCMSQKKQKGALRMITSELKIINYSDNPLKISGNAPLEKDISTNNANYELVGVLINDYTKGKEKTVITKEYVDSFHTWKVTFFNLDTNETEFNLNLLVLKHSTV